MVRVTQYEDLGYTLAIIELFSLDIMWYSQTSTNRHLSTTAIFFADSQYIHSCFSLSTMATFLQWPLSSVPKVANLEIRFTCSLEDFP